MGNFFENFINEADKRRKRIANVASRTVDQVNPLDNGRTYKQRTPTKNRSAFQQLTHNGVTNVAGDIAKPVVRLPLNISNASANLAHRAANATPVIRPGAAGIGGAQTPQQTPQQQFKDPLTSRATQIANPNGQLRQIAGDAVSIATTAFAPGSSKVVSAAATRVLPKAVPKLVPRAISTAAVGAPAGAAENVGRYLSSEDPLTRQGFENAAKQGAQFGAVGGAALPIVGAAARAGYQKAQPVISSAVSKAQRAQRQRVLEGALSKAAPENIPTSKLEATDIEGYADIDPERVAFYKREILSGRKPEPILAVKADNGKTYVEDGKHRLQAYKDLGIKNIPAKTATRQELSRFKEGGYVGGIPDEVAAGVSQQADKTAKSTSTSNNLLTATPSDLRVQSASLPPTIPRTTRVQLNTQRLNLPDEARQKLDDDTAEVINRLSNDEVQRAAKSAGIDTKSYTPEKTRQKIAEQLNLRKDTVRLQNEAEAARQAGDLDRAAQLLKESAEAGRASRTQGTDIARQLQARKIIANELDTPPQKIFKLLDNAGVDPDVYTKRFAGVDFNNSSDVVAAYRELVPPKFGDWLDVVRYNSMLSSPLTHIVNIGSNAINVGVLAPIEKTLRGVADATGGLFGKERRFAAGEGAAYASGAARSLKDAADSFLNAMRTGENQTPDITDISTPLAVGGVKGATYDTLSFPMKLLGASDKFFRTIAEAGEEGALTAREKAGIKLGGNREALKESEASYRLYQQGTDLDGQGAILKTIDQVANAIQTLRKKNRVFGFIFPFVKTPTNILKQGVEYSPLGFANLPGVDDKLTAITRASIGTAVFGASAAMLAAGDLTWSEPINPEEKARWRAEGKQPYSMRINGANVNFSKLPPGVAFPFALTAAIDDAINNKKMDTSTADAIMQGVAKWGQFLGDQSYLKQIGDTLALVKGDPEKAVQAVSNYPQQVIPFRALTGWIARMTDDTDRKINTDKSYIDKQVQSLMLNYPGLRQQVDERTYRGEAIPANNPVLNSFIPFKVTDDRGVNPIDQELDAAKKQEVKNELLTEGQNKEVQKRAGGLVSEAQNQFLNSAEYKSLSPNDRKRGLEAIKKDVTEIESRKYQAENNIGIYAQDYKGDQNKLSARQTAIENGNFDASAYATKGDSSNRKVLKNDDRGTALLDKVSTMNDDQKKQWETQDFDEKYADLIDRANQIKTDDMPAIPKTNKALKAYADYLKVRDGKPSELKLNDAKKDFLKAAYSSQVSDNAKELYSSSYSAEDKISALMSGTISPDDFEKALQLDNQLISWGLQATPKISNKIRREFGYDDAPSPSGSGGGKGGKLTPSDFKLPDFITQYGIKGANLAASARLQ
jgi:hypothetical protein